MKHDDGKHLFVECSQGCGKDCINDRPQTINDHESEIIDCTACDEMTPYGASECQGCKRPFEYVPFNAEKWMEENKDLMHSLAAVDTRAVKADIGKPRLSLIPSESLLGVATVFGHGTEKYGAHNYRKGFDHTRPLDAACRHILAIQDGEDLDLDSGLPHVYHAICSLIMYDWSRLHHPELDDRFRAGKKKDD